MLTLVRRQTIIRDKQHMTTHFFIIGQFLQNPPQPVGFEGRLPHPYEINIDAFHSMLFCLKLQNIRLFVIQTYIESIKKYFFYKKNKKTNRNKK
jgi:hypothetical protein